MTESNGKQQTKLIVLIQWEEDRALEIPLRVRPDDQALPFVVPPPSHSDTTPPFRSVS